MTLRRHELLAALAVLTAVPLTAPAIVTFNDNIEVEEHATLGYRVTIISASDANPASGASPPNKAPAAPLNDKETS